MAETKPRLAITMGDAAGVGPEVIVGAWSRPEVHANVRPLAVAHPEIMRRAAMLLKKDLKVIEVDADAVARGQWESDVHTMACLPTGDGAVLNVSAGAIDMHTGEAAYQCVYVATKLALAGQVD